MDKITTEDCKKKLVSLYPETQEKDWKRLSKTKNSQGVWEREFQHVKGQKVVLQENGDSLIEAHQVQLQNLPAGLIVINPESDMARTLFGSQSPEALSIPFVTPNDAETQFLKVLEHTINWDNEEKDRSTYDYAKKIDFNEFVKRCLSQNICLHESYHPYILAQVYHLESLDEENYSSLDAADFDDSLQDVLTIFKKIKEAYFFNGYNSPNNKVLNLEIKIAASELLYTVKSMEDEELDSTISFLKNFKQYFTD